MRRSNSSAWAEQTGLIKPLTEWVIETGLRLLQGWERQGCALPIAVNLSARNLRDENLLEKNPQFAQHLARPTACWSWKSPKAR